MGFLESVFKKIWGDPYQKAIKPYWDIVEQINQLESVYQALSDTELQTKTAAFREQLSQGALLNDLLPEAFATVRESSRRVLSMRHFDEQLIGGMAINDGKIAEMKTGEGKTLASTLAAYLNALEGKGVYVVTVNDYLAKRDSIWMGKLFQFLGLTVGLITPQLSAEARVSQYACDITYGTNNEFGFDYLRDNLAFDLTQCCQMRRYFAIIDEVDSILIDEARTPLIISGPIKDSTSKYAQIAKIIKKMAITQDFTVDEKHKNVVLTEEGVDALEKAMGIDDIFSVTHMDIAHMAVQCLKALHVYKNDVDYVVKDGEVHIVDEFTGRILDGRRYSDGLHQAIEAVEGLAIRDESQTLASITLQNYFRMFPKLGGMTGTALTEADEFAKIYGLDVAVIPTHRTMIRKDSPDLVYKTKTEKYKAVVAEVKDLYQKQQPVLVGTISIETSELLSKLFKQSNIPHRVLNAKHHEQEAEIIAKAGQKGMVTIATNMAGRGTDIVLGDGVTELGGLHIIGTERHESRRIDNQLRGRSGRQGDPGSSRFYVSLEDELMRIFGSDRIAKVMEALGLPEDTPIEHTLVSKSIEKAQKKVEKYHFGVRKQILEYDDVMNRQRHTIYTLRRQLLDGRDLKEKFNEFVGQVVLLDPEETREQREKTLQEAYEAKLKQYSQPIFEDAVTKQVMLSTMDRKWVDHLHQMDVLREGIGLRAWGQKDPLIEYKIEAFELFQALLHDIADESVDMILKATIILEPFSEKKGIA